MSRTAAQGLIDVSAKRVQRPIGGQDREIGIVRINKTADFFVVAHSVAKDKHAHDEETRAL